MLGIWMCFGQEYRWQVMVVEKVYMGSFRCVIACDIHLFKVEGVFIACQGRLEGLIAEEGWIGAVIGDVYLIAGGCGNQDCEEFEAVCVDVVKAAVRHEEVSGIELVARCYEVTFRIMLQIVSHFCLVVFKAELRNTRLVQCKEELVYGNRLKCVVFLVPAYPHVV